MGTPQLYAEVPPGFEPLPRPAELRLNPQALPFRPPQSHQPPLPPLPFLRNDPRNWPLRERHYRESRVLGGQPFASRSPHPNAFQRRRGEQNSARPGSKLPQEGKGKGPQLDDLDLLAEGGKKEQTFEYPRCGVCFEDLKVGDSP